MSTPEETVGMNDFMDKDTEEYEDEHGENENEDEDGYDEDDGDFEREPNGDNQVDGSRNNFKHSETNHSFDKYENDIQEAVYEEVKKKM